MVKSEEIPRRRIQSFCVTPESKAKRLAWVLVPTSNHSSPYFPLSNMSVVAVESVDQYKELVATQDKLVRLEAGGGPDVVVIAPF